MKIILSPAKTLNLKNTVQKNWEINEFTQKVVDFLLSKSGDELQNILRISDKLLGETIEYIKGFNRTVTFRAIEMYDGLVFKSLGYENIPDKSLG